MWPYGQFRFHPLVCDSHEYIVAMEITRSNKSTVEPLQWPARMDVLIVYAEMLNT